MENMYYVAVYGGFLVVEKHDGKVHVYTVPDARCATSWDDFEEADEIAKSAVHSLYPFDLRYFAIFKPAFE